MYKSLRNIRIIVSVAALLLLTLVIADCEYGATGIGRWLMKVQLVPAILGGSVVWVVVWVIVTLTVGRVYCSSVCPLGTLQDIAGHIGRRCSRSHRYRYMPPVNKLRFTVPIIVGACLLVGITAVVEATDPYSVYCRIVLAAVRPAAISLGGLALAILLFLLVSVLAWRHGRVLCNTICPAGGLLSLLGRQPIYRVDINTDLCIHCDKCVDVCKASCIKMPDATVDTSRCVMCMNCTAICPNDAITVRRGRHQLSTPLTLATGD